MKTRKILTILVFAILLIAWSGQIAKAEWQVQDANIYYNDGNVGIGSTTPNYKLTVKDGDVYIGGDILLSPSGGSRTVMIQAYTQAYTQLGDRQRFIPPGTGLSFLTAPGGFQIAGFIGPDGTLIPIDSPEQIERLRITPDGRVGIGTTDPSEKLTVEGGTIKATTSGQYGGYFETINGTGIYGKASAAGQTTNYGGQFEAAGNSGIGVWAYTTGNYSEGVHGQTAGINGRGICGVAHNIGDCQNYGGYFYAAGSHGRGVYGEASGIYGIGVFGFSNNVGVWGESDNVGIFGHSNDGIGGSFSSFHGVAVYGSAGSKGKGVVGCGGKYDFYANGPGLNYGSSSSIRWKRDIRAIDEPLEKIMQLRGVYFNWDDKHGGQHDVGMIAEEVGKILPEIVVYEPNNIYTSGMDYSKTTPLLVEAIKALKTEIDQLQKENADLRNRMEAMEKMIGGKLELQKKIK
jgi:hypothetical protein